MELIVKLVLSLVLTGALVVAELTLGHFTHCLTLLVVTNQSIQNLIILATSTISEKLKGNTNKRWSYGYSRLPILGLFGSQIFLFSMCFATSVETLQTLFHIEHLDVMHNPSQVCILAGVHFGVWIILFLLLGGNTNHQHAILSQTDEMERNHGPWHFIKTFRISNLFRDLLCCTTLVLATGLIMGLSHYSVEPKYIIYVDPCFALISILILLVSQSSFIKVLCKIILQAKPRKKESSPFLKNEESFLQHLRQKFPSILNVHEFHHWQLTPSEKVLTCHITFKNKEEGSKDFKVLKNYLGINLSRVVIQPEFLGSEEALFEEKNCQYSCTNPQCNPKTCCPTKKEAV